MPRRLRRARLLATPGYGELPGKARSNRALGEGRRGQGNLFLPRPGVPRLTRAQEAGQEDESVHGYTQPRSLQCGASADARGYKPALCSAPRLRARTAQAQPRPGLTQRGAQGGGERPGGFSPFRFL